MFREMRRNKQELSLEESIAVLKEGTSGVLAVAGDDGYPYAVPVSYVYEDNKIYFHSAKDGHKMEAMAKNDKVSFCVINKDQIVPAEYTTYFRSVIAFGKARILEDTVEKRRALEKLALKYSAEYKDGIEEEINGSFEQVAMVEIEIEHLSGKEAIELVKMKK